MSDSDEHRDSESCETIISTTNKSKNERYTYPELNFIFNAIKSFPNIIESPRSYTETKNRKSHVWNYIASSLSATFPDCNPKTALQLRNWWKRTKSRAKHKLSNRVSSDCKSIGDKIKLDEDLAGRGYLDHIYVEICKFCQEMEESYTSDNEEKEFHRLLTQRNSELNNEDSAACFCGGQSSSSNRQNCPPTNSILFSFLLSKVLANNKRSAEEACTSSAPSLPHSHDQETNIEAEILSLKKRKLLLQLQLLDYQLIKQSESNN
ncbi:hypothetical protein Ciccas_005514 [Cichlidogyrus casuarinus]|uniref:Myb/SANT-like DNA-binding domain-containing protein n=1 Tax=Cichlidogyrus casuarinus TaxID=1844966 RepID=A0ABD2Q8H2_9PLAT